MLRLNIRDLRGGPVELDGSLEATDPVFSGLGLRFQKPVEVRGEIRESGDGNLMWQGQVHGVLDGECRRCLAPVEMTLDDEVSVVFSGDPELADDPSVYPLDPATDVVDVTPAMREEIALRASVFPLCRPDCKGLCAKCGADLNAGPCACMAAGSTN